MPYKDPQKEKEHAKKYREIHKERIKERQKNYGRTHKKEISKNKKEYYRLHKKDINIKNQQRYYANREIRLSNQKKYETLHKDRKKVYDKEYRKIHKNERSLWNNRRRVWKKSAGGLHTLGEWENLKAQYNWTCPACGRKEPEIKLTRDHVIPLVKGGSDNIENIQPLCKNCNSSKHTEVMKYDYCKL